MSACPHCSVEVIQAVLTVATPSERELRITLDAKPTDDGVYAAWLHREGLGWIWRTRHHTEGDRLDGTRLRRVHACAPERQLELGGAA